MRSVHPSTLLPHFFEYSGLDSLHNRSVRPSAARLTGLAVLASACGSGQWRSADRLLTGSRSRQPQRRPEIGQCLTLELWPSSQTDHTRQR
jgi:hypothetical protein